MDMNKKEYAVEMGNKIEALIEAKNIKRSKVASDCNISDTLLNGYIIAKRRLNIDSIHTIAKALGVYESQLLPDSWIQPKANRKDTNKLHKSVHAVTVDVLDILQKMGVITINETANIDLNSDKIGHIIATLARGIIEKAASGADITPSKEMTNDFINYVSSSKL